MPPLAVFFCRLTVFDATAAFEDGWNTAIPGAVHITVHTVESVAESVHRSGGQQQGFDAFGNIKLLSQYGSQGKQGKIGLGCGRLESDCFKPHVHPCGSHRKRNAAPADSAPMARLAGL
jgi:hypothetical protein